ncbi:hypothetical protein AAFF_G00183530 [Aldrovandia affinis]|uniref:C1q domain-containing protein n=1 Tax=Aldrovandia affinis TaxID=143900 RepID=A0AAD7RKD4_9TELE|nr:hypothetical protein AAFF_G00183530 [Aldrovandia affinis]
MRGLVLLCLFGTVLGYSKWSESEEPDQDDDPKAGRAHCSAFSVMLRDSACITHHHQDRIVRYPNILLNEGNGYSESSGVFTAPLHGVYSLAVTVYNDYSRTGRGDHFCATLQKNGVVLASTTGDNASIAVVVNLKVGDEVSVLLPPGCRLCTTQNTFTGFLLYATTEPLPSDL